MAEEQEQIEPSNKLVTVESPGLAPVTIGEGEAQQIVDLVAGTVVELSAAVSEDSDPSFSIFDIARRCRLHPMVVAAAMRYNPKVRELQTLLAHAVTSELTARYLSFALKPIDEVGRIEVGGRMVAAPTERQIDAIQFFLKNRIILSPDTGLDTETEIARTLGGRSHLDVEANPNAMTDEQKLDYLQSAMHHKKTRR